jgi:hypothetical protein
MGFEIVNNKSQFKILPKKQEFSILVDIEDIWSFEVHLTKVRKN